MCRAAGSRGRPRAVAAGILYAAQQGAAIINVSISSPVDDAVLRDAMRVATEDSIHGPHVDIAAPGTNVLTAFHAAGDCLLAGDSASASFATAYVSAAAALVAERCPDETPAQWAYRLQVTAAWVSLDSRDDLVGWGVVRPSAALAFVDDGSAPGPPSPVHVAPPPAEPVAEKLDVQADQDVPAPAQTISAWWLLAGVAVSTATLPVSQLRSHDRVSGPRHDGGRRPRVISAEGSGPGPAMPMCPVVPCAPACAPAWTPTARTARTPRLTCPTRTPSTTDRPVDQER